MQAFSLIEIHIVTQLIIYIDTIVARTTPIVTINA